MGSIELNLELQQKITELTGKARECIQKGDYQGFEYLQIEKWNILPDPKEKWEESYRIAKILILFYIKYSIDFEKAKKWLTTLEQLDKIQQQHPGEVSLMNGKIQYEEGFHQEAYQSFRKAFIDSEGHCFGSGDETYESFYLKQGKI